MKKRLLASLLVVAMAASLVACGENDSNAEQQVSKESSEKVQESSDKQEDVTVEGIDINAAYEEPVTITIALREYAGAQYQGNDSVTDNPWTRAYKDRFNIELNPVFVAEGSDYITKTNLAIVENDLPDVFYVTRSQLEQLKEADLLYDLTDVWNTYACDNIKSYLEGDPTTCETTMVDGKMVAIPQLSYGYTTGLNFVYIRKDWKEALNLKDPETMEDVVNIAKAFMENYDAEGIGGLQDFSLFNYLAPAWGAYPGIWVETDDGQIEYGGIQPEMKDALAAWAQWYQDGVLDEDFATTDFAKLCEDTLNGKVGVYSFPSWWGWTPGADMVTTNGPESIFEPYAIPTATGEEVLHPVATANEGYIAVSKDCKNPEAVIKMINFHDTVMYDEEFIANESELHTELTTNGMDHVPNILRVLNPTGEDIAFDNVTHALETGDLSACTADHVQRVEDILKFEKEGDAVAAGRAIQYKAFVIEFGLKDEGKIIEDKLWGLQTETMIQSGATLSDILLEGFTRIIMGEESIDYFDTLVESWKAAGGEQMTIEVNEAIGK